jgi:hypothetical protein
LTSDGIYTNLFTGQERREIAFSTHSSATVEMANTNEEYDVVVIDEIQMIKDTTRGAAWTKALLGLRCKEIHVCGGLEAKLIVQKIAKACGDEFVLHKYKRFAPLKVADRSISSDPNEMGCYKRVSFLLVLLFCVKTRTEVSRTGTWHHISHFNDEFVPFRFVSFSIRFNLGIVWLPLVAMIFSPSSEKSRKLQATSVVSFTASYRPRQERTKPAGSTIPTLAMTF